MRRLVVLAIVVVIATAACSRPATPQTRSVTPLLGTDHLTTSRTELERTIATMREKVAKAPNDVAAAARAMRVSPERPSAPYSTC